MRRLQFSQAAPGQMAFRWLRGVRTAVLGGRGTSFREFVRGVPDMGARRCRIYLLDRTGGMSHVLRSGIDKGQAADHERQTGNQCCDAP